MASPKEETNKPTGFTLNIPKFNRAKENRRGAKKRRRAHSSLSINESDSDTSISDAVDVFDFDLDSPCSDIVTKKRSSKPSPGKKRPRNKVLTSLSNAKHMAIPIPSFQMTRKKKESDLSKRLSELERKFFDEDDDEDNEENDNHSQPSNADNANQKAKSEITESSKPTETVPKNIYFERASPSALPADHSQGGEETNKQYPIEQERETIEESNSILEPIKDILPQSPPRDNFAKNNTDITDENEEGDDSNMVDFGGCDDDVDVGKEDDGSEPPSSNEGHNVMRQPPIEKLSIDPTDACNNPSQISFDLEHQVDLLFEKSDPNTITMKLFCKELERRTGVSLEKSVKKQVKARVMALLRGETVPTTTKTVETSETETTQEDPKSVVASKEIAVQEFQNEEILTNDRNGEEDDTAIEAMVPTLLEHSASSKSKENEASTNTVAVAPPLQEAIHQHDQLQDPDSNISNPVEEIQKSTDESTPLEVQKPTKAKKKNASKPKAVEPEIPIDIELDESTKASNNTAPNPKQNKPEKPKDTEPDKSTKSKKDTTSKPKRQRKRKPKPSENGNKSFEAPKPAEAAKPVAEKKPTQSRKRPRKAAACALCKTCPCQRSGNDCENIATLDVKDFSRSDTAVERTLLRRLLKLEKSTESLEEQTETVRRRLKKQRRDVAKRRERLEGSADTADKTGDSYFLPDAEVFEQQHGESQGLATGMVRKARNRVFQTRQPTLFEMMGIPRDANPIEENGEANQDGINNGEERANTSIEKNFDIMHDDDVPSVYVPEQEFQETIHRFEWKNSASKATKETTETVGGSIFDTVIPLTQDSQSDGLATTIPLWDDLFEASKRTKEKSISNDNHAGLDDLLCLFNDEASNDEKDRIDPNVLSQGAQTIANDVIASAPSPEMLEGSYPNWKENIYFALKQKDPSELEQALENIQESRQRLQNEKEEMLKAWESKHAALQVFEKALQASFHRSRTNPEACTNSCNEE